MGSPKGCIASSYIIHWACIARNGQGSFGVSWLSHGGCCFGSLEQVEQPSPRLGSKLSEGTSGTAKWHKDIKTTGRKPRLGDSKGFARDSSEWKWKPQETWFVVLLQGSFQVQPTKWLDFTGCFMECLSEGQRAATAMRQSPIHSPQTQNRPEQGPPAGMKVSKGSSVGASHLIGLDVRLGVVEGKGVSSPK